MPQFSYKARRRTGEVVEGMLEVADRSAALIQIERLGLFPVAVDAALYDRLASFGERFRSEERRVGKECMVQCRSRWSPYH